MRVQWFKGLVVYRLNCAGMDCPGLDGEELDCAGLDRTCTWKLTCKPIWLTSDCEDYTGEPLTKSFLGMPLQTTVSCLISKNY